MNVYGFPEDEQRQRAEAWVAAWRTMQLSIQRVDRERAERALTELYLERGLEAPDFIWASGPVDAVTAWHTVALGRKPVRNQYASGDTGNGLNREWNRLRDPFGLEPAWVYRAGRRAAALMPSDAGRFRSDGGYTADGPRMKWHLEAKMQSDAPPRHRSRAATAAITLDRTPRTEMLSRLIIGHRWTSLTELLGTDRVVDVAVRAARQAAEEILDAGWSARDAMRSLTFPAFDRETVVMGALSEVLGVPLWRQMDQRAERAAMIERRLELARSGAAYMALEGVAIMLDRPSTIGLDEVGRLHADSGPALQYPDGTALWFDHGTEVPADVITDPAGITVERIDAEDNAEVRRVMTERFGPERLVREGGAELLDEDEVGRLWRRGFPGARWRAPEPVVMVEVRNSTPEPDGSVRTYFLRVPPTTRTAREAVAWTFGLQGTAYVPAVET